MQLVKTSFDFPAEQNSWEAVRYWVGMVARFKQADLACQVMCGFALRELHSSHSIRPGRPEKLPNDSVISSPSESWPEIVRREAGISDDTARNWMAMSDAVKVKWKKLPIRDRLRELMTVPPSQWQENDAELIAQAVHKATDGRTQLEFMWELGIAKKPQGAGARGRQPGEGGRKAISIAEQAELLKLQASTDWIGAAQALDAYRDKFTCLTDTDIHAQIAVLERALTARKAWLKQSLNARDPKAIAALFA